MQDNVENCACPLCGEREVELKTYNFSPYKVVQCLACHLWYLNPRLSEEAMLAQYADDTYFEGGDGLNEGYNDYAEQEKSLRPTFKRMLKHLDKKGMLGGRLLEVGCGYGYLLDEAKGYFDYRMGTDFSSGAVARSSEYAEKIIHGGVGEIEEGEEHFDCIIAVEVIEHIYNPNQFIHDLYHKLKPGGYLILATPDMGSFWRKFMQHKWVSFKLPEHVTYYDESTLTQLYEKAGFENCERIPSSHAFPLSVILKKLHLDFIRFPSINIWLPSVVLGMAARRPLC